MVNLNRKRMNSGGNIFLFRISKIERENELKKINLVISFITAFVFFISLLIWRKFSVLHIITPSHILYRLEHQKVL